MENVVLASLKFVFIDMLGDFFYWPIWWYTTGLNDRLKWFIGQLRSTWRVLALGLWLRNFFVPMYGDRSIFGRAISLVMRVVILVWKLLWFLIWIFLVLIGVIVWLAAPPLIVWMIIRQF